MNMAPQMNFNQPPPPMNFNQPPPQMNFNQPPPQMSFNQPPPPQAMNFQQSRMNFQPNQIRIPFAPQNIQFPQQELPPIPAQSMSPPRPEVPQFRLINPSPQQQMPNFERQQSQEVDQSAQQPELRIHLRRIQIPGPISEIFPFINRMQNEEKEIETPRQNIQVQQMPLAVALSKVGITPDDLRNIQRMAEEKFQQHMRELVADEETDSASDSESVQQSEEESDSGMHTDAPEQKSAEEQQKNESTQELHEASSQQEQSDEQRPQILALGRSNFGRSLDPVQLPGRMTENAEIHEAERADCKFSLGMCT